MIGKILLFKVTKAIRNLVSVTEDADCISSEKKKSCFQNLDVKVSCIVLFLLSTFSD